jgi:hypothetical protein
MKPMKPMKPTKLWPRLRLHHARQGGSSALLYPLAIRPCQDLLGRIGRWRFGARHAQRKNRGQAKFVKLGATPDFRQPGRVVRYLGEIPLAGNAFQKSACARKFLLECPWRRFLIRDAHGNSTVHGMCAGQA